MKKYEIKIWKWNQLLVKSVYEFPSLKEATAFETGLFEGFKLANRAPTGIQLRELN